MLNTLLEFSGDDLAKNRAGYLSYRQRKRLEDSRKRSLNILALMCTFIVGALLIGLLVGGMTLAVLGMIALLCAIAALVEWLLGYRTYRRDLSGAVASIQGQLHYVERGNTVLSIAPHPAGIRVGDMSFLLLEEQVRAFTSGDIYVLYYAPQTHTLLSAERILTMQNDAAADEAWDYVSPSDTENRMSAR